MSTALGKGEVILSIHVPQFRRFLAVFSIAALAAVLFALAVGPTGVGGAGRGVSIAIGLGLGVLGWRYWVATGVGIELTPDELRDTNGRVICRLDEVELVDRSVFGFKPSNGLALKLREPGTTVWELGLWWRWGRRVGIGGSTAPGQNRAMAETMKLLLAERDGTLPSIGG